MSKQTIDVIVPTYNGLPWLKQTVESVFAQTHTDFVLYIIDDGSTDKGATEKYIKGLKDPRVRYHKKENGGQATARNYGIKISGSPYVSFLDSDDVWQPDKLQRQLDLLVKNPGVGMVYGLCKLIDESDNVFSEVVWKKRGNLFNYLLDGNKISGSASMVMIRRSVFEAIGTFHEDFLIGEDWEMWLRIAKDYEIDYVPDYIASLRVRDSGMQQNYEKMARGLEYMLPIMVSDLHLNLVERAKLAKTCLKDACLLYYNSGKKSEARRVFFKSLVYNPFTFFTLNYHVMFLYLRVIFGTEWLRQIRRRTSSGYRGREEQTATEKASTTKNPTVSVLLPVYNGGKYLRRAIQSILDQTYKDFELIIINDGSTDNSKEVIASFDDPRITCINQENQGIVGALETALGLAKGKFVARQDADDTSLPLRLERQLEAMHTHHELVLVGTWAKQVAKNKTAGALEYPIDDTALRVAMLSYNPFVHGSVLVKTEALKNVGGYKIDEWPAEDYGLWARLLEKGQAMNIAEPLYEFRISDSGISASNSDKQIDSVLRVRKRLVKRSRRIIKSPVTLRRALSQNPDDTLARKGFFVATRASWLHLRIFTALFMSLNLAIALPYLKGRRK